MASLYSVSLDEAESTELNDILNTMGRIYGSYQVYTKSLIKCLNYNNSM